MAESRLPRACAFCRDDAEYHVKNGLFTFSFSHAEHKTPLRTYNKVAGGIPYFCVPPVKGEEKRKNGDDRL